MKKLFSIIAAFIFTITCGIVLSACGGGSNERKGEKCYIDYVYSQDYSLFVDATTKYDNKEWLGVENLPDNTQRIYFMKGDTVTFKVVCNEGAYYLDDDFKLVVNGQPINMTAKTGQFFMGEPDVTYYEGSCTINKTSTVDVSGVKEKQVNVTLTAESIDDIYNKIMENVVEPIEMSKDELVSNNGYFVDNSITVKFADKDIFGLEKAEWGLRELNDYLAANPVTGSVKVASGTDVYVYSHGYNMVCPQGFGQSIDEGLISVNSHAVCFEDIENNLYGYKTTIKPESVGENNYTDGTLLLDIRKNGDLVGANIYGSMEDEHLGWHDEGYIKDDVIADVTPNNAIFSISYGSKQPGESLELSDFGSNGKVNVKIKLKKYDNASWKNLYDTMKIKVLDTVLDYTIVGGEINLQLDKPYKYFISSAHDDDDVYKKYGIDGQYMYQYFIRMDIIKKAYRANLVVAKNIEGSEHNQYGDLYYQNLSLGEDLKFYVGHGWYENGNNNSSLPSGFEKNYVGKFIGADGIYATPFNLYVADEDFVGAMYNVSAWCTTVDILADKDTRYRVIIKIYENSYGSPEEQLAALDYGDGQDIIVVSRYEGDSMYSYFVRMRVRPNIRYVTLD